ncbi:MAG: hypothetical protein H7Y04_15575 [Verrucomicrobia bacterium]|nr:hypothetical protein [Cytophagales bacterium]
MILTRICIYAKDICHITGRSERYARQLLERIRAASGKESGDLVTIKDFCRFTKIEQQDVEKYLKD